jgi:phosphoribosylformimino-5-aminoimidazole carboxamide ribotide isomerase
VRLRQGRADDETVYADDPLAMARRWQDEGAEYLHVVDLDGAFEGHPVHDEIVLRIAQELDIPVEIGGGIRQDEQIRRYLDGGVSRVIIGTRACAEPEQMRALAAAHGKGLAVGIDARDGRVQISGWTETSEMRGVDLARRMDEMGVETIIFTDTSRDGMMAGVNAAAMQEVSEAVNCTVIASGGVTTVKDVSTLAALKCENLRGVIVGKALYEGSVTLAALLAAAE